MRLVISSILMGGMIALPMQAQQLPHDVVVRNEASVKYLENLMQSAQEQAQQELALRMAVQAASSPVREMASGPPPLPGGGGGGGQITSTNTEPIFYTPQPKILLPIIEVVLFYVGMVGLVLIIGWIIYVRWKTIWESDPLPPPSPPVQPPTTNAPPSDPYPANLPIPARAAFNVGLSGGASAMDLTPSNIVDTVSGGGAKWTNILQTTLQAKGSILGPWTNFITVTLWSSSSGAHEILVRDHNFNPIYTNYARVLSANSWTYFVGTNLDVPWNSTSAPPQRYFRLSAEH